MTWPPGDLFIGPPGAPTTDPNRPVGQGDVFTDVPLATATQLNAGGGAQAKAKSETAIVVASSCGLRKGPQGNLSPLIHLAPVKAVTSLAPGWDQPFDPNQHLAVMPLIGLGLSADSGANLERTGLASSDFVLVENRIASVSLAGMAAFKARIASYFVRTNIPPKALEVGAAKEWHELGLWEHWTTTHGNPDDFQAWLEAANPNYPGTRRRDTLMDDLVSLQEQVAEGMP